MPPYPTRERAKARCRILPGSASYISVNTRITPCFQGVIEGLEKWNLHQPGAIMVAGPNSPVNFRFSETGPASMAYGGAGAWLKEIWRSGVLRDLPRRPSGGQGWTDGQPVLAAVLLNVPGFSCAEDLERMAADLGICRTARRYEPRILGVGRKQLGRRHPGGRQWTFPSPRALPDWFARPPGRAGGTGAAQGRGDCAAACGFAGRVWRGVPAPVRKTNGMA